MKISLIVPTLLTAFCFGCAPSAVIGALYGRAVSEATFKFADSFKNAKIRIIRYCSTDEIVNYDKIMRLSAAATNKDAQKSDFAELDHACRDFKAQMKEDICQFSRYSETHEISYDQQSQVCNLAANTKKEDTL